MNLELVTQLVILATAVVGLHKAATFRGKVGTSAAADKSKDEGRRDSVFSGLFEPAGIFLFMLAFPAFIWAFTRIVGAAAEPRSTTEGVQLISASTDASNAQLQLLAAVTFQIPICGLRRCNQS